METKTLVAIIAIIIAAVALLLYLIEVKKIFVSVAISGVTVTLSNSNPTGSVTIPITANTQTTISITFSISNANPNATYTITFANQNFTLSTDSSGSGSLPISYNVNLSCSGAYLPLIFNITGPSISNKNNNQFTLIVYLQTITTSSTPTTTSPISSPSPTPSPISSPTPSPTPSGIQVTSFIILSGCTDAYCWGMITFTSTISGTLTKIYTNYSNGSKYCWASETGGMQISTGSNTVWLDDFLPCNHLSCNPPGQIVSLTFVINGTPYTVSVTPTVGNPLAQTPPSRSQIFVGGIC